MPAEWWRVNSNKSLAKIQSLHRVNSNGSLVRLKTLWRVNSNKSLVKVFAALENPSVKFSNPPLLYLVDPSGFADPSIDAYTSYKMYLTRGKWNENPTEFIMRIQRSTSLTFSSPTNLIDVTKTYTTYSDSDFEFEVPVSSASRPIITNALIRAGNYYRGSVKATNADNLFDTYITPIVKPRIDAQLSITLNLGGTIGSNPTTNGGTFSWNYSGYQSIVAADVFSQTISFYPQGNTAVSPIYSQSVSPGTSTTAAPTNTVVVSNAALQPNTTYTVIVSSVMNDLWKTENLELQTIVQDFGDFTTSAAKPATPAITSATDVGTNRPFNEGAVSLSWNQTNNGSTIVGYKIEFSLGPNYLTIQTHTANTGNTNTSGTFVGFLSGSNYKFYVTAIGSTTNSDRSNESSVVYVTTVPSVPRLPGAIAGNAQALVAWELPTNDGGKSILDYRATSIPGGITATANALDVTVTGLTNYTAYTFTIAARNANGRSAESSASNSVTPQLPLPVGSGNVTIASNSQTDYIYNITSYGTWSNSITSYDYQWQTSSDGGTTWTTRNSGTSVASVPSYNASAYKAQNIRLRVWGRNQTGASASPLISNTLFIFYTKPTITSFVVTPSELQAFYSYAYVADDPSATVTLQFKLSSSGTWSTIAIPSSPGSRILPAGTYDFRLIIDNSSNGAFRVDLITSSPIVIPNFYSFAFGNTIYPSTNGHIGLPGGNGSNIHEMVRVATTSNININTALEDGDIIDGITLSAGNRVLVKNQNTLSQNGIYVVQSSGPAIRATDYDSVSEIDSGDFIFVQSGSLNANTGWVQRNIILNLGVDPVEFSTLGGTSIPPFGRYIGIFPRDLIGNTSASTGYMLTWSDATKYVVRFDGYSFGQFGVASHKLDWMATFYPNQDYVDIKIINKGSSISGGVTAGLYKNGSVAAGLSGPYTLLTDTTYRLYFNGTTGIFNVPYDEISISNPNDIMTTAGTKMGIGDDDVFYSITTAANTYKPPVASFETLGGGTSTLSIPFTESSGCDYVTYNIRTNSYSGTIVQSGSSLTSPINLSSLSQNTIYYITLTPFNYKNQSGTSIQTTATTAPPQPTVTYSSVTSSSFTVSWNATGATHYSVEIFNSISGVNLSGYPLSSTTNTSASPFGLNANTSYTTVVRPRNSSSGFLGDARIVSQTTLFSGLTPVFGTNTRTNGGFSGSITNYDSNYTWSVSTSSGTVSPTSFTGTGTTKTFSVTGVTAGSSATVTVTSSRSGYDTVSNTTSESALSNLITNPAYGTATPGSLSFTASISTSPNPTGGTYSVVSQTNGTASVNSSTGALSVTGLTLGQSSTATVRYSLAGYNTVDITSTGSASSDVAPNNGSVTVAVRAGSTAGRVGAIYDVTASASGTPTPTVSAYQWQFFSAATSTWTNITGATLSSYTISYGNSTYSDIGRTIRCRVTFSNGVSPNLDTPSNSITVSNPTITSITSSYSTSAPFVIWRVFGFNMQAISTKTIIQGVTQTTTNISGATNNNPTTGITRETNAGGSGQTYALIIRPEAFSGGGGALGTTVTTNTLTNNATNRTNSPVTNTFSPGGSV